MKKILTIFTLIIGSNYALSQNDTQETLAKLYITECTENGKNITEFLLEQNAFLAFYTINKNLYLSNFWKKNDTQSAGRVYKTDKSEAIELDANSNLYTFNWDYINTYDSKSGTALIEFIEAITPNKKKIFELKITTNDKELIYRGYIKGDFDLSFYLKDYKQK